MKNFTIHLFICFSALILISACTQKKGDDNQNLSEMEAQAKSDIFVVVDSSLFNIVNPDASLEKLTEGFEWSEGPVWVSEFNSILFSDVPTNQVYKWNDEEGLSKYLNPSGYTGEVERGGEMGSNGLTLNNDGQLVLCQHGDRQVALMDAPLDAPEPNFKPLADNWEGKRFNSPNDVCFASNGNMYFTDPPYGLVKNMNDSSKEIHFQGVYLVKPGTNEAILVVDSLTRPNGIALTPDESQIIVANSDPDKIHWYIFDVNEDGTLTNGQIYFDGKGYGEKYSGLPDGLKIDSNGNVFATGPGGIWIFNSQGDHLGIILTGHPTANCAFGPDEKTLYITADMHLMRLKM